MREPPLPKSADDDSPLSLKVKTQLEEFLAGRGFRTPSGDNPAAMIADALARRGGDVAEGFAEFLRWYGGNLRDPPVTWKHVLASFDRWTAKPNRCDVVQMRKGPLSQRGTTPQPSRYQLARLADPFEANLKAEAV